MKRFRGGLVFKAHRLVYHSTLGLRVIKRERDFEEAAALRRKFEAAERDRMLAATFFFFVYKSL